LEEAEKITGWMMMHNATWLLPLFDPYQQVWKCFQTFSNHCKCL
jgi:hypothetical protein